MIASVMLERLNYLVENGEGDRIVVIDIDRPSIGAGECVGIKNLYGGIDWEGNQIRIIPESPLDFRGKDRDDELIPFKQTDGHKFPMLYCRRCQCSIKKDDRYCRACGQKQAIIKESKK